MHRGKPAPIKRFASAYINIVNVLEQSCPIVSVFESSLKDFITQAGFKALP